MIDDGDDDVFFYLLSRQILHGMLWDEVTEEKRHSGGEVLKRISRVWVGRVSLCCGADL